jgi:Domain of unknown function (DUF4381)
MPARSLLVLVALFLPAADDADGVALPEQTHGDIAARLTVHVADAGPQPGAALVRLTLAITGGSLLQVEPARLADPLNAWEPQVNEWCRLDDGRLTWTQSILLRQIKPGPAALPDVKVRFRQGPGAAWQDAEWVDVLKTARDAPPPEPSPPLPSGMGWLPWAVLAAPLTLAALAWGLRFRRARPRRMLPPDQRALQDLRRMEQTPDLDSAAFHTTLSNVVRRYLAERFGLPATRQTTAEFLETVRRMGRLPPEEQALLRDLLERCDLAKFAPVGASAESCRETAFLAQGFVERTAGAGVSTGRQ